MRKYLSSKFNCKYFDEIITISCVVFCLAIAGCSGLDSIPSVNNSGCSEENLKILKIKSETYCDKDTCITCPIFLDIKDIFPGDTLAMRVSANYDHSGHPLISDKSVNVNIRSASGDTENYKLIPQNWRCQTSILEMQSFTLLIPYTPISNNGSFHPNNGILEIKSDNDTLIASYTSYCTGNLLKDTVYVRPK